MIKSMLHNIKTGEIRWGDEGLLAEWNANPDLWIWADFDNADPEHEMKLFVQTFNLHPLAISDAKRERHPQKLVDWGVRSAVPRVGMRDPESAVFIDNGDSNMDRPYSKSRLWLRNPMKNGGAPLPIHLFTDQLQEFMAGTMILAERPEHHG